MCYPVCGMVHIKEPLLLIDKSSLCGGSRFPFSLSEWSLTICLTPYNHRLKNVLSALLNKTFLSFSLGSPHWGFILIIRFTKRSSSVVEQSLMVWWVVRLNLTLGNFEIFLVPASDPQLV